MHGSYKWFMLLLLSLAFFFSQADRVLFGLLTIPIQEELHLTDLQIGVVNTALFVTLALTVPLAGLLGDRFNRKWVITGALLFWSAMTAATGLVGGICGMIFFRSVLTGGGDGLRTVNPYVSGDTRHKPLFGKIPRPPRLSSITHQQKGTRQWCAKQSSAELAEWCAK